MVEYFDERSTEFRTMTYCSSIPDFKVNTHYVLYVQHHLNELNKIKDLRLSDIYNVLGIPFPDNYLLDYKLKKNQPAFELKFDKKLNKIVLEIDVPDQPVLRDLGDAFEYTYPCDPKKNVEYTFTFKKED